MNQYEIAPGHSVEVSGINLGTDLEVQVMLVGAQTAVLLGNALCDGHGDFIQNFTLPTDLPEGVFTIQAVDTSIVGLSVVLAETKFKIDEKAPLLDNSSQIVTFTNTELGWQQPLYLALAGLTLFLFILPSLLKWRRSKNNGQLLPQSHLQK